MVPPKSQKLRRGPTCGLCEQPAPLLYEKRQGQQRQHQHRPGHQPQGRLLRRLRHLPGHRAGPFQGQRPPVRPHQPRQRTPVQMGKRAGGLPLEQHRNQDPGGRPQPGPHRQRPRYPHPGGRSIQLQRPAPVHQPHQQDRPDLEILQRLPRRIPGRLRPPVARHLRPFLLDRRRRRHHQGPTRKRVQGVPGTRRHRLLPNRIQPA